MPKAAATDDENKRKNKGDAAKWFPDDIEALIETLYINRNKYRTGDNSASFKTAAWQIVAEKLAELHEERPEKDEKGKGKGGVKTPRACMDKWKSVSHILLRSKVWLTDPSEQLKEAFKACRKLQGVSGFAWSPFTGCQAANLNESAWKDWVKIKVSYTTISMLFESLLNAHLYRSMHQLSRIRTIHSQSGTKCSNSTVLLLLRAKTRFIPEPRSCGLEARSVT